MTTVADMLERTLAKQAQCKASAKTLSAMVSGTRREWLLDAAWWGARAYHLKRRMEKGTPSPAGSLAAHAGLGA